MAVGKVSFDDWDMLTSSLGWTGSFEPSTPPASSMARLEMTSLAFMFDWVPLPGLPDAEREVVVQLAVGHLEGGGDDEGRLLRRHLAEVGVDLGRGLLQDADGPDQRFGHPVVADREVVQRARRLGPPVAVGGDLDGPHGVRLGAGARQLMLLSFVGAPVGRAGACGPGSVAWHVGVRAGHRQRRTRGLAARRAGADQVELVAGDHVALLLGHHPGRLVHGPLEPWRRDHVLHRAADGAGQVVVVPGQVLGQLEPAVVVDAGDPADHAGLDQRGHVAVGAGLREGLVGLQDLGDRQRPAGARPAWSPAPGGPACSAGPGPPRRRAACSWTEGAAVTPDTLRRGPDGVPTPGRARPVHRPPGSVVGRGAARSPGAPARPAVAPVQAKVAR